MKWTPILIGVLLITTVVLIFQVSAITSGHNKNVLVGELIAVAGLALGSLLVPSAVSAAPTTTVQASEASAEQLAELLRQRCVLDAKNVAKGALEEKMK